MLGERCARNELLPAMPVSIGSDLPAMPAYRADHRHLLRQLWREPRGGTRLSRWRTAISTWREPTEGAQRALVLPGGLCSALYFPVNHGDLDHHRRRRTTLA